MSSTRIHAEIAGVWLPNKGAELMALTAITELRNRIPEITFCSMAQGPDATRDALGMPAFEPRTDTFWHRHSERFPKFIGPRAFRAERPGVTHVIDASGFAYGDTWGPRKAKTRAAAYIRNGLPTYLLPQAFGPFENPKLRSHMIRIVSGARSIAARDAQSLAHIDSLGVDRAIPRMPDITLGLTPSAKPMATSQEPFAALVVNAMLLKKGTFSETELIALYGDVLARVSRSGIHAKIVLHEPDADFTLSEELAKITGAELVQLSNPLEIKNYISNARLVVTARFHGLANGLSSGVPSLAIGWTHKYQELLQDFGTPSLHYDGDNQKFLLLLDELLTSDEKRAAIRSKLLTHQAKFAQTLSVYWDGIAEDMLRTGR